MAIIQSKMKENNLNNIKATVVQPRDVIKLGVFRIEFIRVNHSIPDAVSIAIHTPLGTIVVTGDFKLIILLYLGRFLTSKNFLNWVTKGFYAYCQTVLMWKEPASRRLKEMLGK